MSTAGPPTSTPPPVDPSDAARRRAEVAGASGAQKAGGLVAAVLTACSRSSSAASSSSITTAQPALAPTRAIFDGAGVRWFWVHFREHDVRRPTALNLQQTLLRRRAHLHGPRGRVRVSLRALQHRRPGPVHRGLDRRRPRRAPLAATALPLAPRRHRHRARRSPAPSAGIAGFLKATVGAHEVITTIMLNWIVSGSARTSSAMEGRSRTPARDRVPSDRGQRVPEITRDFPLFWGDPLSKALHYRLLRRDLGARRLLDRPQPDDLGYEVRAVGHNPEAARYGGISVARNYFLAMAIAGLFAGLAARSTSSAGSTPLDVTRSRPRSWLHRYRRRPARTEHRRRRRARGAPLRRTHTGTTRGLDPDFFQPNLAGNLRS